MLIRSSAHKAADAGQVSNVFLSAAEEAEYEEYQAEQEQAYINQFEKANERRFAEWLAFPGDR